MFPPSLIETIESTNSTERHSEASQEWGIDSGKSQKEIKSSFIHQKAKVEPKPLSSHHCPLAVSAPPNFLTFS